MGGIVASKAARCSSSVGACCAGIASNRGDRLAHRHDDFNVMDEWKYQPAGDPGHNAHASLRSLKRETGLVATMTQMAWRRQ